jgi:hypothetical protein
VIFNILFDIKILFPMSITTGELFFAVRQYHTAKAQILSAKALPCGLARQRTHGNDPAGKGTFAVRRAKIAR